MIITISNISVGNQLPNLASIIVSLQAIIHQLLTYVASSTLINYHCKQHQPCYSSLYLYRPQFYIFSTQTIVHKRFCSTFKQRIAIRMCMRTHGRHMMVTETSKTINFQSCFFHNTFLYWLTTLLVAIISLYWQVFSGR